MKFVDKNAQEIPLHDYEVIERRIAEEYIRPDHVVLELGARYGTVTCTINNKLKDRRNHFAVEPDGSVYQALWTNCVRNNCEPYIFQGAVSQIPLVLQQDGLECPFAGYGNFTIPDDGTGLLVQTLSLDDIQEKFKLKFNALVADCEGALDQFVTENVHVLSQFDFVTYEKDNEKICNYEKVRIYFENAGLNCVDPGSPTIFLRNT